MLPVVLILVVAAGIAWPFLAKRGLIPAPMQNAVDGLVGRLRPVPAEGVSAPVVHEQICPQCTAVNPGTSHRCIECGVPLLAEKVTDLWQGAAKEELIREGVEAGVLLVIMIIAMILSNNLPVMGKIVVLVGTIALLAWRFMNGVRE